MSASWPAFKEARRRNELMDAMMSRFGVDLITAIDVDNGNAFVQARSKCRSCCHESECRAWLNADETRFLPPDFCPNACFFRRCGLLGAYGLWRERRLSLSRPDQHRSIFEEKEREGGNPKGGR
jgi:hypothetical protein